MLHDYAIYGIKTPFDPPTQVTINSVTVHAFIMTECCESIAFVSIYIVIDFETVLPRVEGFHTLSQSIVYRAHVLTQNTCVCVWNYLSLCVLMEKHHQHKLHSVKTILGTSL